MGQGGTGSKILTRNPIVAQSLGLVGFRGGSYDFGLFSMRLSGSGIRQGSRIRQQFRRFGFRQSKAEAFGEFRYQ